jgi:hypothetical protein
MPLPAGIEDAARLGDHGWQRVEHPALDDAWRAQHGPDVPPPVAYQHRDGRTALVGREPVAEGDWRWHISLRHGDPGRDGRIPTWEECVATAHELRPGVVFVIGVPPRSWWINVHPHVLHLHETRDMPLVEQWRHEARGDRPT